MENHILCSVHTLKHESELSWINWCKSDQQLVVVKENVDVVNCCNRQDSIDVKKRFWLFF